MAVAPTGNIFKALSFDNVSSRSYGVYITGQAVYNAPEREVEMISIPGRNGQFALDKGRFENIEVTYPAGIFADSETDFAEAISDFRNFLCSRKGYVRLTDEYNPNEYRMAIYKSGLEVEPALLRAGEFEIVFDCKPQRFLTSGEAEISVASGDTLTNPTGFEASPLIKVRGYGTIGFNGYSIALDPAYIGDVTFAGSTSGAAVNKTYSSAMLLTGDTITLSGTSFTWRAVPTSGQADQMVSASLTLTSQQTTGTPTVSSSVVGRTALDITVKYPAQTFAAGSDVTLTDEGNLVVTYKDTNNATRTVSLPVRIWIINKSANPANSRLQVLNVSRTQPSGWSLHIQSVSISSLKGYSTQSLLGDPTYIDCDLGEAYKYVDGALVSLNGYIDLGSDLPKLASGANEVTFSNTFTEVLLTPRWWKI